MTDRTIDPVTGEIIETPANDCQRCAEEHKRGEAIRADLLAAEASLRRERRRSQALEGQIRRQLEEDPKAQEIREVLTYWQTQLDHPSAKVPIDGERAKRVRTALRHKHTVAELKEAIDGAAAVPYVVDGQGRRETGTPEQRRDDLDLICRDETTIKRFRGYAQRAAEREAAAVELTELLAKLEAVRQSREGQWVARCPAHDDRHASLSVAQGEKGLLMHCHSGCRPDAITAALDVGMSALFSANGGPPARTRTIAAPSDRDVKPLPSQADIDAFVRRLVTSERLLGRLEELRGWTLPALVALEVGFDGERLTLPVRDAMGRLVNVMKYRPGGAKPKLLPWGPGHPRGLFPAPETIPGDEMWVLEGEPDAITARELGLPAVAVPGANGWQDAWAERLAGRRVVVVADADEPGRAAAARVARSLAHAAEVRLLDLDETRMDGYDLTDAAMEGATAKLLRELAAAAPVVRREEKAA